MLKPATNSTRTHPTRTYERVGLISIAESLPDRDTEVPRVYMDGYGNVLDEVVFENLDSPFRLPNTSPDTVILE